jgi:hypothetical protein
MENGAAVSRNGIHGFNGSSGGGVYVSSGTFSMGNGSTVSNNTIIDQKGALGGGVYVSGGTFKMYYGATIGGNKLECTDTQTGNKVCGGGVYQAGGIFEMNGGVIYGSDEPNDSLKNTVASAASGTVDGAAYFKSKGTVSPNTMDTTNDTIRTVM